MRNNAILILLCILVSGIGYLDYNYYNSFYHTLIIITILTIFINKTLVKFIKDI
jgi:hypothetical protein